MSDQANRRKRVSGRVTQQQVLAVIRAQKVAFEATIVASNAIIELVTALQGSKAYKWAQPKDEPKDEPKRLRLRVWRGARHR